MLSNINTTTFKLISTTKHMENIYVIIICTCSPCVYYFLSGSNIQHSILNFTKGNTLLSDKKYQVLIQTIMLAYLVIHNIFFADVYVEDDI